MKKLIFLTMLLVMAAFGYAAVNGMVFAYSTGTYTENATGTVLGVATNDDTSFNNLALPFTFYYNGTGYTNFSVQSNGFIAMGATVASSYYPLSTGSTNNVISALSRDLQGQTGSTLTWEIKGTLPNRYALIQWKNYKRYGATGDSYNFQIKLYETSNAIEIVYGPMTNNATATTVQVGLRGASNADFNNRTTADDWANTSAGTLNSDLCALSTTVYPANGATFTWTIPAIGVLNVNPNPIAFGTGYTGIGLVKQQLVTLSNSGGADFTIAEGGITFAGHADFTLGTFTLPVTLTPGGTPLTFYVYYTPTEAGAQTATLTIADSRATTDVPITGTGAAPLLGEICEYPYEITASPTTYDANTLGYANDYTAAMFTGLTNSSYVTGLDWVAKLVLTSEKQVNISVADQVGYTYQYLGVYLVGSIPSVASPAAVLGQALAATGTITIPTVTLPAGTYYIIVDNWPSPVNMYFTLNVSYADPTPPLPATLVSPTPSGATGILPTATLNWASGGGGPTGYKIQYGTNPEADNILTLTDILNVTTYDPPGALTYSMTYYWKVVPYNGAGQVDPASCPIWSFTVMADPTQPVPYTQNFDSGTSLAAIAWSGTMYIGTVGGNPTNRLTYNLYSSAPSCNAVSCPIGPLPAETQLLFDYRLMNWSSYPNGGAAIIGAGDNIQVQVSNDGGTNWSAPIYTINSTNHTTSTDYVTLTIPVTGYSGNNVLFRFVGTWGNGDYYVDIDNVVVRQTPAGPPLAPTLTYPVALTGLPQVGFNLTWAPNPSSGPTDYYNVYLWTDEQSIGDGPIWSTTGTSLNPTNPPLDPLGNPQTPITFAFLDRYNWTVEAYADAYPGEMAWPTESWFEIQGDPRISIPYTQDFGTTLTWPQDWTQSFTTGGSNRWAVSNSNTAGGVSNEMKLTWVSGTFISRLITPPIDTDGVSMFQVNFKQTYDGYGAGITAKLQYSHDLENWTDTSWYIIGDANTIGPNLGSAVITDLNAPTTYVAWALDGNHYQVDYWYVDDVELRVPPQHDVGVVSWDYPAEIVPENTLVVPVATVSNNGLNTETFTVTCTIDTYSETQTVAGLAPGLTQQVVFPGLTPALWTLNEVVVSTNLGTDEVSANDQLIAYLGSVPLNTPALANNAQTDQFVQFNLSSPGVLNPLPTAYTGTYFMSGADWMNGKWMAVEYDNGTLATDNYYEIDPLTGAYLPSLGEPGAALMGIAYDDNNDVMYGVGGTDGTLYTVNTVNGLATTVAVMWYDLEGTPYPLPDLGGLMIACAYDNYNDTLYGVDLGNDCLWIIDPATAELTFGGYFGVDLNYAQDAAFDQENGLLFLAAYSNFGGLYVVDLNDGSAYLVGPFGTLGYELDAFAIPYGTLATPEPVMSTTGALTWDPVPGDVHYKVYKATDPYGVYAPYATVYNTTWTDPLFSEGMAFYQVVAVGGVRGTRQAIQYRGEPKRTSGSLGEQRRFNIGVAK